MRIALGIVLMLNTLLRRVGTVDPWESWSFGHWGMAPRSEAEVCPGNLEGLGDFNKLLD